MLTTVSSMSAHSSQLQRWLVTITAIASGVAVTLAITVINTAIPAIMGYFGMGQITAQWMSTAFLAAMTSTMLMIDWLDKAVGLRFTFISVLSLFVFASLLGAISPNEDILILSRVLQGAAAGIVQPISMLAMFRVFPPEQRGKAMGIFAMGTVLAPAVAPLFGGIVVDLYGWRHTFYIALPFALIGLVLSPFTLPGRDRSIETPKFDWLGFTLMLIITGGFLTAFVNGQRLGWSSLEVVLLLWVSIFTLIIFILWELRTKEPLIELRLFLNLRFASAAIVSFLFGVSIFVTTYMVPLFVQTVQGLSATQAGLILLPQVLLALLFPLGGYLSDRMSISLLASLGMALIAISALLTSFADLNTSFWFLTFWVFVGRFGNIFVFPAVSVGALRPVPANMVAQASGTVNCMRQLGGAFGVNLFAVFLERRTQFFSEMLTPFQNAGNTQTMELLDKVKDLLSHAGLPLLEQAPMALGYLDKVIYVQSNMYGFKDIFVVLFIVCALSIIVALAMKSGR